jgi:hypothetical protein
MPEGGEGLQAEIASADRPLVVVLEQERANQVDHRGLVREDATTSALDGADPAVARSGKWHYAHGVTAAGGDRMVLAYDATIRAVGHGSMKLSGDIIN